MKNLENFFIVVIAMSFFLADNAYIDYISGVAAPIFYFYLRPGLFAGLGIILVAVAAKSLIRRDAIIREPPTIEDQSFELGDTTDMERVIAAKKQKPLG
ncbi:hypothetical protein A3I27_03490 [Candidatus Giovannonibacteria bacterium RIFCSPLOWO2_02_FULL_43_11b]|uniref:Uncharacterized protein n=1 Tax=Candidatus Giovannonibacteria bacterium RIFCSPHIGHO2_12_FULL_43_15 TaxID=1798341 RepID=A0A1F5WPV8_9BACT|nr:MAG: hypothetical protein A2739_03155 [Candidatus Giovannonibacteria bacterium RIFCSPHIGHO2_01_FULL_43_100]OGF66354.1 MAG: hypothetical protein A3B97_03010 [Candidatus Giovannonibacteria bacterium RIFCSPHIGHO2_02_FULL_43_32]OGF77713.1 MAG: hypothetical protein A3F23_01485 [Candidatus Giovannonibacteria bacterium RIFCSPHIGHO2_12_FULL_43_15]OGF78054.1 MAG: hypothetical protein A3A15_01840 [Candidatus Giovannonibacteria bacterium RIFCSPLOWO2_01_FULL_43_60]OGF89320.1 MAG: hypothetical protein A3